MNNANKVNWSQLLEITCISVYITKNDQINVSMTCKYYRNRLIAIVFNKLTLLRGGVILHFNQKSRAEYKHKLQMLIEKLNLDLKGVGQFIQVLELCDGFSTEFSSDLLNLFPNIRLIKVYSLNSGYNLVNLVNLLSNLKHLNGVELSTGYYNYPKEQNGKIIEFFKTLTSLKLLTSNHLVSLESVFLKIDQSFTKLNSLTILDDTVLANLQFCMPNLTRIELPDYKVNEELLVSFIKLNPQLKRMGCTWHKTELVHRIWSPYITINRKIGEYKTYDYHCLFLAILRQYNIKYILMDYNFCGDPYINIVKVTWTGKDTIEILRIYHTKYNEINWTFCKGLSDVLVFKYNYCRFFEFDSSFNYSYNRFDWKFVINE